MACLVAQVYAIVRCRGNLKRTASVLAELPTESVSRRLVIQSCVATSGAAATSQKRPKPKEAKGLYRAESKFTVAGLAGRQLCKMRTSYPY